jgi:tetratricopeptide (TPR) repeat protein
MKIHPSDLLLQDLVEDPDGTDRAVADHLATCALCRSKVEKLLGHSDRTSQPDPVVLSWPEAKEDYGPALDRSEQAFDRLLLSYTYERAEARLLLTELMTQPPGRRELLLSNNRRFQTWGLFELLTGCSRNEVFSDPQRGEHLARLALKLSAELDSGHYGAEQISDLQARAWGYMANCLRTRCEFQQAQDALALASAHLRQGTGDLFERANILDLRASLLRDQRQFEGALRLLKRAITIFRSIGDHHRVGRSLINLSTLYEHMGTPSKSIKPLYEAQAMIDSADEPRLLLCVRHNLAVNLADAGRTMEATGMFVRNRSLYDQFPEPWTQNRKIWLKAKIARGHGEIAKAEQLLKATCQGFLDAGAHYDSALVTIDLISLYLPQGRRDEAARLRGRAAEILQSQQLENQALERLGFSRSHPTAAPNPPVSVS